MWLDLDLLYCTQLLYYWLYCIYNLNCNGIRDPSKRKQVFSWLHLLLETHPIANDEQSSNDSRGIAILIKNQVNYDILDTYSSEGRILLIKLGICSRVIIILNLYAPQLRWFSLLSKNSNKTEFECRKIKHSSISGPESHPEVSTRGSESHSGQGTPDVHSDSPLTDIGLVIGKVITDKDIFAHQSLDTRCTVHISVEVTWQEGKLLLII